MKIVVTYLPHLAANLISTRWLIVFMLLLHVAAPNSTRAELGYWGWKHAYYHDVGTDKQFFIDEAIIEEMQGLTRVLHSAQSYENNPVLRCDQPWENDLHVEQYGSVLYDEEEQIYKMWYQLLDWPRTVRMLAYATSRDGVHWEKPDLGVVEFAGTRKNNIVFGPPRAPTKEEADQDPLLITPHKEGNTSMLAPAGEPIKDLLEKDPAKRYKMLYRGPPNLVHYMTNAAHSPDGIHWTPYPNNPVIPLRSDSANNVFWDPRIDRFVAILRIWEQFGAKKPLALPERTDIPNMRVVARSVSKDFVNWTPAEIIVRPDEVDGPDRGNLHDMAVMQYEGVYFGLLGVMLTDPTSYRSLAQEVQFAFSRDGIRWSRPLDRKPIIPTRGPEWTTVLHPPLVVGDEIYIYYTGLDTAFHPGAMPEELRHGVSQAVGLAKMRLDGFVSVRAGDEEGTLTTDPFVFEGDELVVNGDATGGKIDVEVLLYENTYHDAVVRPAPGYTRDDCLSLVADEVRHTVGWQNGANLSRLQGKTIKLKFYLQNADLYSFQFQQRQAKKGQSSKLRGAAGQPLSTTEHTVRKPASSEVLTEGIINFGGEIYPIEDEIGGGAIRKGSPYVSDTIPLKDGRLLLVSGYWRGGKAAFQNEAQSQAFGIISEDNGETWSDPYPLITKGGNIMPESHASLMRLKSGAIGLIMWNMFYRSEDEGKTWSDGVPVGPSKWGLHVRNGSATVLSNGRIVAPAYMYPTMVDMKGVEHREDFSFGLACYSDDEGHTWRESETILMVPLEGGRGGFQMWDEWSVVELKDNRLLGIGRTILGRLMQCYSDDQGKTWHSMQPTSLASSNSPCAVKRIPTTGDLLIIWNQTSAEENREMLIRHRLSSAISRDEGQTWESFRNLESLDDVTKVTPPPIRLYSESEQKYDSYRQPDDRQRYHRAPGALRVSYPTVAFKDNRVIVTYGYGSSQDPVGYAACKIKVLPIEWFYEGR